MSNTTRLARTVSLAVILGLATAGCGASAGSDGTDPNADGTDDSAIIGGARDSNDPAIVELVAKVKKGEYTCTASFISQTALVTAAHCVTDEGHPHRLLTGAKFSLMTAASDAAAGPNDKIPISRSKIHVHPDYDGEAAHDVAIVEVDSAFDVTPIPVRMTPLPSSLVGSPVRIVGYGVSNRSGGGGGKRRSVTTKLRRFEGDLLLIGRTGTQACDGDSGGPALATIDGVETIIGLDDVAATSANCAGGDLYQRPDEQAEFIQPFL